MSAITAIGTATPSHRFSQSTIADFMVRATGMEEDEARRLRALYRATGIEFRHSALADYGRTSGFTFYADTPGFEPFPTTTERLAVYRQQAAQVSARAATACLSQRGLHPGDITHLIVVSCTGMYAPGLDIDLVKQLGLSPHVVRTGINFMGCYAAFTAIKTAYSFCEAFAGAKALVVCTEFCSLHFQKEKTEDNLLANALFADGSAAVLLESGPAKGLNLIPENFHCDLSLDGENDMAWTVGDRGFEMKLSSYVPQIIQSGIGGLAHSLLAGIPGGLKGISYFAIHPGGKRILESIEQELQLKAQDLACSYRILREFGNMSSPTVLFVLRDLIGQLKAGDHGRRILSFAFGPGLTLESMVLRIDFHGS